MKSERVADGEHYLETELRQRIASDRTTWDFVRMNAVNGVWYWDLERPDQEYMSPEFWALLGREPICHARPREARAVSIFPEDRIRADAAVQRNIENPDQEYDEVLRYKHADGSTVWIRSRGIVVRDENGKPTRMIGAQIDETASRRARQEAVAARDAAQAISDELRAFAYSVSHDLKSPANSLMLLLTELAEEQRDRLDEEGQVLFDLCCESVARMKQMIEDLLSYSRVVGQSSATGEVDLTSLIGKIVEELQPRIAETGAHVELGDLPCVEGIEPQLQALFRSLLVNALTYRSQGRPLLVRVHAEVDPASGQASVTVSDNGIGIEERHHQTIFKIFKRLHLADEIPGSGLGLALCRRVALNHGREISLESTPGAGSAFTVHLSLTEPAP